MAKAQVPWRKLTGDHVSTLDVAGKKILQACVCGGGERGREGPGRGARGVAITWVLARLPVVSLACPRGIVGWGGVGWTRLLAQTSPCRACDIGNASSSNAPPPRPPAPGCVHVMRQVAPEALTVLADAAMRDIAHLLRPAHLQQVSAVR